MISKENKNFLSHNLQLVSLHIPKTAGTSFRNILKSVYGKRCVTRFDIDIEENVKIEEKIYIKEKLPKRLKVIHGHFYYSNLIKRIDLNNDLPIITWLRDPVERVVSNYYYLSKVLEQRVNEKHRFENLLGRMQKTLLEFADLEENQNVMSKFLGGSSLEDFSFVGIQEHFKEDTKYLASLFRWDNYNYYEHNKTGKDKKGVSDEIRNKIKQVNSRDVELYEKGLELRLKRQEVSK